MSYDILHANSDAIEIGVREQQPPESTFAESVFTTAVAAFTILFVSSVAVVMYLA